MVRKGSLLPLPFVFLELSDRFQRFNLRRADFDRNLPLFSI
jgi:hypothetical protein